MTHQKTSHSTHDPVAAPVTVPDEEYYRQPPPASPPPARTHSRSPLGIALIVVGLIWLVTTLMPSFSLFRFGDSATLLDQTLPGSQIVVDAGSADVTIERWSGDTIHVRVVRQGGSDNEIKVNLQQDGNTVRVSHTATQPFFFWSPDLSYRIQIPEQAQATVQTASGDVYADGVNGGLEIKTVSGDVELDHITGLLKATTISGNIELDDAQTTSASLSTTSGELDLDQVANSLVLETVSGDISVSDAENAQLSISTTSGEIDYQGSLENGGNNTLSTISGDISLKLPEDSSFTLDASTVSGELHSAFELRDRTEEGRTIRGTAGNGETSLIINTTSGDVSLED